MISRSFLLLLTIFALGACESGGPNRMSLEDYEGPEGEAVVRHLLTVMPQLAPEVPKVYSVVKGEKLLSTTTDFVKRMDDLRLTFISGEVLTLREPDKSIVDPRSGLAPVVLQISEMTAKGGDRWEVVAGWAYKKSFERSRYLLEKKPGGYQVSLVERIEGNYVPPDGVPPSPSPVPAPESPASGS
jgi:hypothetical protein